MYPLKKEDRYKQLFSLGVNIIILVSNSIEHPITSRPPPIGSFSASIRVIFQSEFRMSAPRVDLVLQWFEEYFSLESHFGLPVMILR